MKEIRRRVGHRINIDMRISGEELIPGGLTTEEMIEFVKLAQGMWTPSTSPSA
ncbi:MAG: hypothetical protein ACLUEK_03130 [Oscillospiraceae bacterium]